MASVVSVERVSVSLPDGTAVATVALSKNQVPAKCVPFATRRRSTITGAANNYDLMNAQIDVFDNAGTPTVRVTVDSTNQQTDWSIAVVEFGADVNVQTGTVPATSGGSAAVAITAVDQSRAAIVWTGTGNGSGSVNAGARSIRARFTSDSEITLSRFKTAGTFRGRWYVFEDTAGVFSVQSGTISMLNGVDTTKTATISSVTTAKSWVLSSMEYDGANSNVRSGAVRVDLQNATTVRALRNESSQDVNVTFFVISFDASGNGNVQRGLLNFGVTGNQLTAAITAVDLSRAMVNSPMRRCHEAAGELPGNAAADVPDCIIRLMFNVGGTQVVADRTANGSNGSNLAWEAVEWPIAGDVDFDFGLQGSVDLVQGLSAERPVSQATTLDVTLASVLRRDRGLVAPTTALASFQASLTAPVRFGFSMIADADHAAGVILEKVLGVNFDATLSALTNVELSGERNFRFTSTAQMNFVADLDSTPGFVASLLMPVTMGAAAGVERGIILNDAPVGSFQLNVVRESPLSHDLQADADFAELLGAERPLAVDLQVPATFASAVRREARVVVASETDATFDVQQVNVERQASVAFQALASFAEALAVERPISAAFDALAVLQQSMVEDKSLVAAFDAQATLTQRLDAGRGLQVDWQALVNAQATLFDRERGFRLTFTAAPNFSMAQVAERLLEVDMSANADLQQLLGKDFVLGGFAMQALGSFQAAALRQRGLLAATSADAEVGALATFGRGFAADVDLELDVEPPVLSRDLELVLELEALADHGLLLFTDRIPGSDVFVIPAPVRIFVIPIS